MKILVTGTAGFIGFSMVAEYISRGYQVIGIDNINDYYDTSLKTDRLSNSGIETASISTGRKYVSKRYPGYTFIKGDITDKQFIDRLFAEEKFDYVCHLAAQAGVRYSLENPYSYINSNIVGFLNILEACRACTVRHLVWASSSSVYGMNPEIPFSEEDRTDKPVSLYAATKKSDEVIAYSYSSLYGIPTTGLRFFTVYGPWGRPDMAPFIFLDSVLDGRPVEVFNNGDMYRDFTYIDDIVRGVAEVTEIPSREKVPYALFNIGNGSPVHLMDFIAEIEKAADCKAVLNMRPMQPGDVYRTFADTTALHAATGYKPSTGLGVGISRFAKWYMEYYRK